jgi:hypothetical protein
VEKGATAVPPLHSFIMEVEMGPKSIDFYFQMIEIHIYSSSKEAVS